MDSDSDISSLPTIKSGLSTPSCGGVGLSNPDLPQSSRQMLDVAYGLNSTGVQVYIDIPQVVVVGSQSSGKTSLIEGVSGITLPRAAGTCTRCPTDIRLTKSSEEWKCVVSRRIIDDGKVHTEQFGDVITNRVDVEDRVRRAQWAILNPTLRSEHGASYFLTSQDPGANLELSFSHSSVSLQISGPDVADLSFCDLPGLIAGVGSAGNTADIDLVKNLVASYIERPSCIILLTVACETDFQNQGAQEIAKKYDPLGKRTIGVLTKPDRIPLGEESIWLDILRNEKEPLENRWYCVKQPSSAEISAGMAWEQARQAEDAYFTSTPVWSGLDVLYKECLRTENLVKKLSHKLSEVLSKRLPEIQDEIEKSIITTRDALDGLPKAPSSDPRSEIFILLHIFGREISRHMEGVPEDGLLQAIRPAQEEFRRSIQLTAPDFQPFEKRHASSKKKVGRAHFRLHEEADEHDDLAEDPTDSGREVIYIDEVLERANQARTRELPGNYPFVVQQTFIKNIVAKWREPARLLCRVVHGMLAVHVQKLLQFHLGAFGQGQLAKRVKLLLQIHLKMCLNRAEERIEWLLKLEDCPFTLNMHYFRDYKDKFLAQYRSAREKARNPDLMNAINRHTIGDSPWASTTTISKVMASLAELGISGIKPEALAKLIDLDGTEPALIIMADVRAYFQVAYKRFTDNIPLAVDYELLRGVERNILQTLNTGLGINGPNGDRICTEFAREDDTVAMQREELTKKLKRLTLASQQLLKIF